MTAISPGSCCAAFEPIFGQRSLSFFSRPDLSRFDAVTAAKSALVEGDFQKSVHCSLI
jgi:hypothetical protein